MMTKLSVERWSTSRQEWYGYGAIVFELPFANARHFNFCMELTSLLDAIMCKHAWMAGRYRLGGDDEAILEWDGVAVRMTARPRTVVNTVEKVLQEIAAEEDATDEQKTRN